MSAQPPPYPQPRRQPLGYPLLAVCAWTFAVLMALALVAADDSMPVPNGTVLLVRVFAAALAVLALVTGEALWRVRPWAFRVSLLLAATYLCAAAWVSTLAGETESAVGIFAAVGGGSLIFIGPALAYLRDRHRQIYPTLAAPARKQVAP